MKASCGETREVGVFQSRPLRGRQTLRTYGESLKPLAQATCESDKDGAVTAAGDESIQYEPGTFRIATRQLGSVDFGYAYDEYGQLTSLTSPPLDLDYTYDDLGRVIQIVETDQGTARTLDYTYDLLGQLVEVRVDGAVSEAYTYDANGNRLSGRGVTEATHNAEDELLTYGSRTFSYSAGQLTSVTDGGLTTTYDYGTHGQLRAVDDGTTVVSYEHDAFHRRVGKRVDGTLVQGFLYQDQLNPIAELAADGTVRSRFVYASRAHVPDFMIQGGATYAFVTDHLGSVRYVADTSDGSIAQRIEYDAFGQVLSDSSPGFQPFGFAGGLYDSDTGLVRFGVRDYDPSVGRWTARDPIGFGGGQANLFVYVNNSPQDHIDPTGLFGNAARKVLVGGFLSRLGSAFFGAVGGASLEEMAGGTDHERAAVVGGVAGFVGAGVSEFTQIVYLSIAAGGAAGAGIGKALDILTGRTTSTDPVTDVLAAAGWGAALACVGGRVVGGAAEHETVRAALGGFADLALSSGLFIIEELFLNFDKNTIGRRVN